MDDLALLRPREILFNGANGVDGFPREIVEWAERECPCRTVLAEARLFAPQRAGELLLRQFGTSTLRGFGLYDGESVVRAAAAALAYAQETQKSPLSHVRGLAVQEARDRMVLDASTLANPGVFRSQRAELGGPRRRARSSPSSTGPSPLPGGAPSANGCAAPSWRPPRSPSATEQWASWRRTIPSGSASGSVSRGWEIRSACSPGPYWAR